MDLTFESSPELARLAARRFIRRQAGAWLLIIGSVAIGCMVALVMGFHDWYLIVGVVLSCGFVFLWGNYYRRSDEAFRSMPDPTITVRLKEDCIEFETSEHASQLKWSRIKQVWKFHDVWLLFTYDRNSYALIPTVALTDEAAEFIETHVLDHGGSVT